MVGRFIGPQNYFSLVCSPPPYLRSETLIFLIDALSIIYLTDIHGHENSQTILDHLKRDEFVKHDYSDCLRPEYTILDLIASLLDACNITANKPSYGDPV